MVISHNIQALNTNRISNENINLNAKSTEKISSGYKINHVGDNPVGLAMSETMRRQIRGLNQGIENTKAAINFCQTADGALNEVTEMLQRINELAVKAENGTNLDLDRHYLQSEVDQLLTEIDRVADTTTFNEIPIFRWALKEYVSAPSGPSIAEGDVPYKDFALAGFDLGNKPFGKRSFGPYDMNLQVKVTNPDSPAFNTTYNMLLWYEHSFRLFDKSKNLITTDGPINLHSVDKVVNKDPDEEGLYLITDEYKLHSGKDDGSNDYCQRTFIYKKDDNVKLKIIQTVTIIPEDQNQEKKYNISYSFENLGNTDVVLDFMAYSDTLYGKNYCGNEFYFVKDENGAGIMLGQSQSDSYMFIEDGGWGGIFDNGTNNNIIKKIPDSLSLIDPSAALAFSEKVSFEQNSMPDAVSVGYPYHYQDNKWDYSDHDVRSHGNDWGYSLYWNLEVNTNTDHPSELSFNYGIAAYDQDDNIHGEDINKKPDIIGEPEPEPHYEKKNLWIQTGSEKGSGLWLEIDEMNTEVLGIDKINLTTIEGAADANTRIKEALHKLALSRSKIGAQQNRLEHTVTNEENIVEKVTASESRIRDTDLSSEMVRYSNLSVLLQMGQHMIAQADQRVEKILTIFQ